MVRRLLSKLTYANVIASVALFFALGGGAYAAVSSIPSSGGTIHACYATSDGALRVVAAGRRCARRREKALSWSQRGPAGARGAAGTAGAGGATGAGGAQGTAGAQGATGVTGAPGAQGAPAVAPPGPPIAAYVLTLHESAGDGGTIEVPLTGLAVGVAAGGAGGTWQVTFDHAHDAVSPKLDQLAASGNLAATATITAKRTAAFPDGVTPGPFATWALTNVAVESYSETGDGTDTGQLGFSVSGSTPAFTLNTGVLPVATLGASGTITYTFSNAPGGTVAVPVYGVQWGVTGGGAHPTFDDVAVTEAVDPATARLLAMVRNTTHATAVKIELRNAGEARPHLTYELSDVSLDSLDLGSAEPQVRATLGYAQIRTTAVDASGTSTSCWDLSSNSPCH